MKGRFHACGVIVGLLVAFSGGVAQAAVTLTDNGTTVTLANGLVTATIQKNNGQITSMRLGSLETVSGNVYYSMDGGTSYQQPGPTVYSITTQTADLVDLDFFQVWTTQIHQVDIDVHVLIHYGRNHYNGSSTTVAAGESWSKIYGPSLLYVNSCPTGADACWSDAQSHVQTEHAAWPYSWLSSSLYPQASGRGTITGRFIVNDRLKTSLSGAGAWVGVAQPDLGGNWQFESKRYEYWAQADSLGNFSIPNVRPGTYTLSAFVDGAVGEYTRSSVTVGASATTALGNVTWNVFHPGNSVAWEIGVPDRSAAEFRNGNNYSPFLYDTTFTNQFPNPLNYTVGASNWANDWNYAQSGYGPGDPFNYDPAAYTDWPWNINFNLASVPASNPTLTIQLASAQATTLQVFVNDPNRANPPLSSVSPDVTSGNSLVREGRHAKYPSVTYISIPVASLRAGSNTITLLQTGGSTDIANHVMYDYLNLEMP